MYKKKPQQYTLYKKGRNKEYAAIKELKEEGFSLCQRSPGSRGPVDIWAVNPKEKRILLVQVKSSLPQSAINKLVLESGLLNGEYKIDFEVWQKDYVGNQFERTKLEGDLLKKFKLSESERLEFDRIKKKKARRLKRKQDKKEKILNAQREKDFEISNKKWKRKQARELKLEKQREEELLLKTAKGKEEKLNNLNIEEQRIESLSTFQMFKEDENDFAIDGSADYIMLLKKKQMLESIKSQINYIEAV